MRKTYCDKCRKEIPVKEWRSNTIRVLFYDKEGCKREIEQEYCKKCYKKVKKEVFKMFEA